MNENVEIILIEDSINDAKLTIRALHQAQYCNSLIHLKNGEEALEFIFSKNFKRLPKLILLDIGMPKVNGLEVLKKLKSVVKTKMIPVVILTSSSEMKDISEAYKLGANAYIVKPIDFKKFTEAVQEIGTIWLTLNQPPVK